jgi:2-polyprenyl-3-methyl-5-hydroxy-6-metoxy-1,4-benzoquinol methylase
MIKNLFYNQSEKNYYKESDLIPYDAWSENDNLAGITISPDNVLIFTSKKQLELKDEYSDKPGDPYWEKTNPGYPASEKRMLDCTMELIKEANIADSPMTEILDLACGTGLITSYIQKAYPTALVIGLDISFHAITEAAKEHQNIQFIVADAFSPPLAPGSFDLIVCNNFWEHIENPFQLARVANNLLKPEGVLIISTPSRYHFENLWSALHGRKINFQNPTYHFTEYTVGQVIEQLSRQQFEVKKIISKTIPNYNLSWKSRLKHRFIKPVIASILQHYGSHHIIETTAFFLAQKKRQNLQD